MSARKLKRGATGTVATDLTDITLRSSATATGTTIVAPSDIQAGDLLVLSDLAFNSTSAVPTAVTPSGFTNRASQTIGSFSRHMVHTKKADGSEAGATITGMAGTAFCRKQLTVHKGNIPAATITISTVNAVVQSTNPTAQNVAASGGTPPLVVIGAYACDASVNPRTMSPAKDGEITAGNEAYQAWKIQNTSPVDVSVDMDDEGGVNYLVSFYAEMAN